MILIGLYNLLKLFVYITSLAGLVIAFFYTWAAYFGVLEECLSFFGMI